MKKKLSDAALKELAVKNTMKEIAIKTGFDYDTIRRRCKELGIKAQQSKKIVTPESIKEDIRREEEKQQKLLRDKKNKVLTSELLRVVAERDALLEVKGVETYDIKADMTSTESQATAVVLASDWHIEELVLISQTSGLNEFNLKIAKKRVEKLFKLTAKLLKIHQKEYDIKNLILALLGDFISGSIHDDLSESNMLPPTDAVWEAQKWIASGIEYLLKETDVKLIIPCSSGNHGRTTAKQRIATEFGNSLEILMYKQLKEYFKNEKRIQFVISNSYHTYINVYDYTLRFHHGHAIRYQGGIGGIFIPVFKAIAQWNKGKHANFDFFGHFHQQKDGDTFICNGSLIGYNAFAVRIKADFEEPKQAFIIIEKDRGMDCVRKINLV